MSKTHLTTETRSRIDKTNPTAQDAKKCSLNKQNSLNNEKNKAESAKPTRRHRTQKNALRMSKTHLMTKKTKQNLQNQPDGVHAVLREVGFVDSAAAQMHGGAFCKVFLSPEGLNFVKVPYLPIIIQYRTVTGEISRLGYVYYCLLIPKVRLCELFCRKVTRVKIRFKIAQQQIAVGKSVVSEYKLAVEVIKQILLICRECAVDKAVDDTFDNHVLRIYLRAAGMSRLVYIQYLL